MPLLYGYKTGRLIAEQHDGATDLHEPPGLTPRNSSPAHCARRVAASREPDKATDVACPYCP